MASIVLIDPDRAFMTRVRDTLMRDGHEVRCHVDLDTALPDVSRRAADLVILELRLPAADPLYAFERLRDTGVPVVLTSLSATDMEEAMVLRLGAWDYLAKPVSMRVLSARVDSALRHLMAPDGVLDEATVLIRGPLRLDRLRHEVRWDGEEVALTATEFSVLWIIAQRPGQVLSRANILDLAYGGDVFVTDRSIDSQIKRIRRKLRSVAPEFAAIETLYGLGYRFSDSPEDMAA